MKPERLDLSALAALPLEDAVTRLRQIDMEPRIVETRPPGRTLIGELRVLAVRQAGPEPVLIVSRSWPPPGA